VVWPASGQAAASKRKTEPGVVVFIVTQCMRCQGLFAACGLYV
jgi:hypothetical protein